MKIRRFVSILLSALTAITAMTAFTACGKEDEKEKSGGKFIITLYPDVAPITCENFQKLVEDKFYDGLTFHRVIEDFMAQGGAPKDDGTGEDTPTIKGEFIANGVNNTIAHTRGVVSMARTNDYNSASSQFFICYDTASHLDGNYAAFGLVTEGMDVVDGFLEIERTMGADGSLSSPVTPITIKTARMIENDSLGNPRVEFTVKY